MRSQKVQREKVNFKIRQNEIGKYSPSSVDLNGVSEEYLAKFTDVEIEKAKELKAKQKALHEADPNHVSETAYTDAYYLDYAKTLTHQEHVSRQRDIFKTNLSGCDIKDLEWAQYSYEEILQMEQDGYNIPQEIIEWAHAQQQADVTDYIVLTDNVEGDDASTTDDVTGSDELTKLRAQALNDIAKIEKAEKETDKEIEEYNRTKNQAKSIQTRSAFFKDMEFKKLEEKTKEWKKLNEKKQAGKLNKFDENRYNNLTKELKGAEGGIMFKIESSSADLDEFLGQIDKLNEKISDNEEIVTKAIQDATDLSSIERQYAPSRLPVPVNSIRIDGNGLSTSTLYGIRTEDISTITVQKGEDLSAADTHTNNRIQSANTQKLVTFATEYSAKVEEATGKTKEAVGETGEDSSKKVKDKENSQNENPEDKYRVEKEFSAPNSVQATETTLAATADMISAQVKTIKEEKNLKKETTQAQKDVQELEQKAGAVQAQHQANLSQEEIFLMQLDELNSAQQEATATGVMPDISVPEQADENAFVEPKNTQAAASVEEQNIDSPEKAALIQNIASTRESDAALTEGVTAASEKSKASTARSKIFANVLRGEATTFEQARKTAQKVAGQTMSVGIGTVAKGYVDGTVGANMVLAGTVMMHSFYPPTVIAGMGIFSAGSMLLSEGMLELTTGTIATGVGMASIGTATAAEVVTKEVAGVDTTAQAEIKNNEASITESDKAVGIDANVEVDSTVNNESPSAAQATDNIEAESPVSVKDPVINAEKMAEAAPQVQPKANTTNAAAAVQKSNVVNEAQNDKPQSNNTVVEEQNSQNKNAEKTQNSATDTIAKKSETKSNSQSAEVDETTASEEPNAREAYDVKKEFSITGAANATATTIKASQDVLSSRSSAHEKEISFNNKLTAIRKLNDSIDKNRNLAESITRQQEQKAAQAKAQIENENDQIQKAAEEGDVEVFEQGQTNVQNLAGGIQDTAGDRISQFDSSVSSINDSVENIQNDRAILKSEITDFNNKINEQLDVSQKTIVVGAGTLGVGVGRGFAGALMYMTGSSLLATAGLNIAQHVLGIAMMAQGGIMITQGGLEEKAGLLATATGAGGLAVNASVKNDKINVDASEKTGNSFLTITRSGLKQQTAEAQELDKSRTASIEEVNLIAASATANANSVDKTETDDKSEKKLARFNKETEIESRKKRKKVIAVSASTRG